LYSIELHAHILPGVDDGPETIEETMDMIGIAYSEGIRVIIATPHCGAANPKFSKDRTRDIYHEVIRLTEEKFPDMRIAIGNELYYSPGILDRLQNGEIWTMAGSDYVLIEFDVTAEYNIIEKAVREFVTAGYRPVIAHAERYQSLIRKLDRVEQLIAHGAYIQINSRSFLKGRFDKRAGWCRKLLQEELVHFVSSDCHNTTTRKPIAAEVTDKLLTITDKDTVEDVVYRNAIKLMKNEYI